MNKYLREFPKKDGDPLFSTKNRKPVTKPSVEYLTTKYKELS